MTDRYEYVSYGVAYTYLPEGNYTLEELKEIVKRFEEIQKINEALCNPRRTSKTKSWHNVP